MPIKSYGILKGKAIEVRVGAGQSPHYEVRIIDATTDYRIAINVMSQLAPSEVEYVIVERFEHPITALADRFPLGFTPLQSQPNSGALDFIRGNLFNRSLMRPLPANLPGFDNDLNDKIDRIMQRAISDEHAVVCAFARHRHTFGSRALSVFDRCEARPLPQRQCPRQYRPADRVQGQDGR